MRLLTSLLLLLSLFNPLLGFAAEDPAEMPTAVPAPRENPPPEALMWGLDDLMTLLVQPRHVKLYYAGTQKNWELAAAEASNLRGAMLGIAKTIGIYTSLGVRDASASLFEPALTSLDAAIATADSRRFASAYKDVTAACNACHVYKEHSYILVNVPERGAQSNYAD